MACLPCSNFNVVFGRGKVFLDKEQMQSFPVLAFLNLKETMEASTGQIFSK